MEKSTSACRRQLETENEELQSQVTRLERQLREEKLRNNAQSTDLRTLQNELSSAKQNSDAANTEFGAKFSRLKLESSQEISQLQCEIDSLKLLLRGKYVMLVQWSEKWVTKIEKQRMEAIKGEDKSNLALLYL